MFNNNDESADDISETEDTATGETGENPPLIYTYGCLDPIQNADSVRDQLYKARKYQNTLVAIERQRRGRYQKIRAEFCPRLDELEIQVAKLKDEKKTLQTEIKTRRQKETAIALGQKKRAKRTKYPELDAQIKAINEVLKPAYAELSIERAKFNVPLAEAREEAKKRVAVLCKESGKFGARALEPFNAQVLQEMLQEPQWHVGWKTVARSDAEALSATKAARKESRVYAGTYLLVDAAMEAAKDKTFKEHTLPSFKGVDGTGRVGVRLKHTTWADVLAGTNSFLRMREVGPLKTRSKKQPIRDCISKNRINKQQALVDIRVGSDEKKNPVWATFPVMLHRPIPPEAVICVAWILVRKHGIRFKYTFQLNLKLPNGRVRAAGAAGAVALHLAWRQEDLPDAEIGAESGLRVGYAVGTDGVSTPIFMPTSEGRNKWGKHPRSVQDALALENRLRGFSDEHFNVAREVLVGWLKGATEVPAWMRHEASTAPHWRMHGKLERITRWWLYGYAARTYVDRDTKVETKIEAAPGILDRERVRDLWRAWHNFRMAKPAGTPWSAWTEERREAELFASFDYLDAWFKKQGVKDAEQRTALYLEWWCRKDSHLKEWERRVGGKARHWRKHAYRFSINLLAKKYAVLIVDDMKLNEIVKRAPAEKENALPKTARRQRVQGAPGELREIAKARFSGRTVVVDYMNLAALCCECDSEFLCDAQNRVGRCNNGHSRDRDENAALNMLKRGGFSRASV